MTCIAILNILTYIHLVIFLVFYFVSVKDFFYLHKWLLVYLIRYLHEFFYLYFQFFYKTACILGIF